jgi:dipeptidyl aminopeptidase/acylaminoacyl peptidase
MPRATGSPISAYLTVPAGSRGKKLPVIVIVHDGPSARVRWGWDPLVQFLASRGFAVFQPNYRGSDRLRARARAPWDTASGGSRCRTTSPTACVARRAGIANPTRVGIYGVGYGGYAALLAAAKTPELFRAAASFGA